LPAQNHVIKTQRLQEVLKLEIRANLETGRIELTAELGKCRDSVVDLADSHQLLLDEAYSS